MTQREIVEALYAEEMAIDDFMSDQSEERLQAWLEKKAVVDALNQDREFSGVHPAQLSYGSVS